MLDRLPLQSECAEKGTAGTSHGDVVSVAQTGHVRFENRVQGVQTAETLEDALNLRGTAVDKDVAVDADIGRVDLVDQPILEESLGNSDEDGAAKGLEELDTGCTDRDPFLGQDSLDHEDTNLEPGSNTQACQDLVTEPLSHGGVNVKGGDHAGTDGVEDHARDHDNVVVTDSCDDTSRGNRNDNC